MHHCKAVTHNTIPQLLTDKEIIRCTDWLLFLNPLSKQAEIYTLYSYRITTLLLLLLHPFNSIFSRTTWVSQYEKGKTSPDLNEARDDEILGCSGISWTICKQSAPRSRHITTAASHHSIFTGQMLFL